MQWTEITISTTTDCAEIIAQILVDCGSYGAAIRDRHDLDQMQRPEGFWDMIDEALYDQLGQDARVTGYFRQDASLGDHLSALHARLEELSRIDLGGIETGSLELTSGELSEQDWANAWRKYYKPTPIGEHLVIKPTWEQYQPRSGDRIIHMDPGTAFGTGTHETTSMCLELCEKYVRPGDHVIDVGCGTAILSIASILMGAKDAIAVDIDLLAVDCARENVALNHMEDTITVRQGDLLSGTDEACDVMFANIVAGVIVMLAPDVPKRLKQGGRFICSGIIKEREAEVSAALTQAGYQLAEVRRKGEWVAMCWSH